MSARITAFLALTFLISACGRAGPMLRPEPGVTIMKEADKPAEKATDKPSFLDILI